MKILFMYGLLLGCLATPTTILGQKMVTVKGKIIDRETGKPPYTMISIIEKGNLLSDGLNNHTIMERDGSYKLEVKKGSTVLFKPILTYKNFEINNVTKNSKYNFTIDKNKDDVIFKNPKLANISSKQFIVSGVVVDSKTKKPLKNVTVAERWILNEKGNLSYTLTDSIGRFSFPIHKGNSINFYGFDYETQEFDNINSHRMINVSFRKEQEEID